MRIAPPLDEVLGSYDAGAPLDRARTIPASWYADPRVADLERVSVFRRSWQAVGRADQVREPGAFLTAHVAGEPVLVIRGRDGILRGFFNVCRHHAAAVETRPEGTAHLLRCPYHGWTYSLEGQLKGTPDFAGVRDFDRAENGLAPLAAELWEGFVSVRLARHGSGLAEFLGSFAGRLAPLRMTELYFFERRRYVLNCNWKVFIDNYLDGGYHVPHLHKGLDSVLDYSTYTIENGERFCLQSSPLLRPGADAETAASRRGDRALYYWIYPNFMVNWYEGTMDTNRVVPLGVDRTEVIFDFFFSDVSPAAREANLASVAVAERIQAEDVAICESVQRGLQSAAYEAGRLSVRREAGEHLFHRLLAADLQAGPERATD